LLRYRGKPILSCIIAVLSLLGSGFIPASFPAPRDAPAPRERNKKWPAGQPWFLRKAGYRRRALKSVPWAWVPKYRWNGAAGQFFTTKAYTLLVFAGIFAMIHGVMDIVRSFQIRKIGKMMTARW